MLFSHNCKYRVGQHAHAFRECPRIPLAPSSDFLDQPPESGTCQLAENRCQNEKTKPCHVTPDIMIINNRTIVICRMKIGFDFIWIYWICNWFTALKWYESGFDLIWFDIIGRSAECQHHTTYPVQTYSRQIAPNFQESWPGLRRESSSLHC